MVLKKLSKPILIKVALLTTIGSLVVAGGYFAWTKHASQVDTLTSQLDRVSKEKKSKEIFLMSAIASTEAQLSSVSAAFEDLRNDDQVLINTSLTEEIANIRSTYTETVKEYELLLDVKSVSKNTGELDKLFAQTLSLLANREYTTASAVLKDLRGKIATEKQKYIAVQVVPESLPVSTSAPANGYQRVRVAANGTFYQVDIVAGDMGSTKVIVDTGNDGDCSDNCTVLSLGDYVGRNGAYAGINGGYFCPASYPSCAGKTNTFDTLVMNKNKTLINVANNVYSTVPGVAFYSGSMSFYGQTLQWGKDQGADSYIANRPLLLSGGTILGNADDAKQTSIGPRSFVGNKGGTAYIGVVYNANVYQAAQVLSVLGLDNALNLDSGGSTALWAAGGYKAGPGRAIPNAILFVNK